MRLLQLRIQVEGEKLWQLSPRVRKRRVDYNGGRTLDDFVKFIESGGVAAEPSPEAEGEEEEPLPEEEDMGEPEEIPEEAPTPDGEKKKDEL